ncbi:hypothetical protein [Levilactobacillus suantsaiihabitans]|uniref:S-layer protein n=1 Tax=Levilactobacillus suantsaiihabitans TaxID=2487722 RepID=A0A4Z0JAU0_9LACO|nr:hypothetical protein [Levilactobacillus suantsaiihabitans]TGD19925.1 hypothetical protein EGT51_01675 [Levilactobacillus suantsaiihabitans]
MQSSLKKSLYLGLAALSFVSVAAVSTNASAKSYAKAGAYTKLTAAATDRNVEATGTNALYTKPGTVKGAKIVASKKVMGELATSKKSANYFRAYGQKVTNRGSVYYRVVTMDGKYRGYVYGGKTEGTFAAGVKKADTTTKATMPAQTTVYFANPGKTNVTWTAPKYTQYKASKNVVNTTPFAGDKLTITDAATKTREGSLYYYVKDETHPSVSGWIYSKAVTTDANVAYNQATDVKVNFVASDGTVVTSGVLKDLLSDVVSDGTITSGAAANAAGTAVGKDANAKANAVTNGNTWLENQLKGTGYSYIDSNANTAALLAAKTGDTVTISVKKGDTVATNITAYKNTSATSVDKLVAKTATNTAATSTDDQSLIVQFPAFTTSFNGVDGAAYTSSDVQTNLTANKAMTLYSVTYAHDKNGKAVPKDSTNAVGKDGNPVSDSNPAAYFYTVYTFSNAKSGNYSATTPASAYYNFSEKSGEAPVINAGSGSTNSNWDASASN